MRNREKGNEEHFQELFDSMPTTVYATDAEGKLTYFNKAAIEFLGRSPDLNSDNWCLSWKLYHHDGTHMHHEDSPLAVAIKEGRTVTDEVTIAECPDGKRIWFKPYPTLIYSHAMMKNNWWNKYSY